MENGPKHIIGKIKSHWRKWTENGCHVRYDKIYTLSPFSTFIPSYLHQTTQTMQVVWSRILYTLNVLSNEKFCLIKPSPYTSNISLPIHRLWSMTTHYWTMYQTKHYIQTAFASFFNPFKFFVQQTNYHVLGASL